MALDCFGYHRAQLTHMLPRALQAATDKITSRYAGQSVDEVTALLLTETRAGLHPDIAAGWTPDQAHLRAVAEAVVRDATS